MSSGLLHVGTFIGLFVGYFLGFAHALWRRARSDYRDTRKRLPNLRQAKWDRWWSMVRHGIVALLLAALAIAVLTRTADAIGA